MVSSRGSLKGDHLVSGARRIPQLGSRGLASMTPWSETGNGALSDEVHRLVSAGADGDADGHIAAGDASPNAWGTKEK